jgi:hypothetical protein
MLTRVLKRRVEARDMQWIIAARLTIAVLCFFALVPRPAHAAAGDDSPLGVARRLSSTRFRDFTYGPTASKKQVDCVQFLGAVLEEMLGRKLTTIEADAVYIRYDFADLQSAVSEKDPRTKGVVRAVAEVIKCGTEIPPRKVQPNDVVQYWYRSGSGRWLGHASIVSRVWERQGGDVRVAIFGAHKSTNGIAENDFGGTGLSVTKSDRLVFVARIQAGVQGAKPSRQKHGEAKSSSR